MGGTAVGGAAVGGRAVGGRAVGGTAARDTAAGGTAAAGAVVRAVAAGGASALAARAAYAGLRRWPPAGEKTWTRTNHRGEPVTLLEGPAVAVAAVAGHAVTAAVATLLTPRPRPQDRHEERLRVPPPPSARVPRPPAAPGVDRGGMAVGVAGLGALAFGVLDDLRGSASRRGLRGHLGALAHGEVTTGTVKLAGLAATGVAAAILDEPRNGDAPGKGNMARRGADVIIDAGLIAGGANLLNLFDLRPGRAIKVATLSAGLIAAGGALTSDTRRVPAAPARAAGVASNGGATRLAALGGVAAPVAAALALLPEDLGERAMLGDAGANALGAVLGAAAARTLPRRARIGLLAGIVALTVASEKVSFTRVIERTPPLRWLDMLGRLPVPPAAPGAAGAQGTAPRRRVPGRHRRVATGVTRNRSSAGLFGFLKTRSRQEP